MPLEKAEHILLLGEIGTTDHKFYRKMARMMHPDKNRINPAAQSEFVLLAKFKEIYSNPADFASTGSTRTISRKYFATDGNKEYSSKATISSNLHSCTNPDLLAIIKILYDLSDQQMEHICQKLDNDLIDFMQHIFNTGAQCVFSEDKLPDKDLMVLLKNSKLEPDNTLTDSIKNLGAQLSPSSSSIQLFKNSFNHHLGLASGVVSLYTASKIFHANLLQILLHLAYTHKEEQQKGFWSRYKKDIIELLGVVLKAPISLLVFSLVLILILFIFIYMPIAYLAAIAGVIPMHYVDKPGNCILEILHQSVSSKQFIDESLEKTFNVKFFATKLAESAYNVQEILPAVTTDIPHSNSNNDECGVNSMLLICG